MPTLTTWKRVVASWGQSDFYSVDFGGGEMAVEGPEMFEELSPPYSTIVVDPPWRYDFVNPAQPGLVPGHGSNPIERTPLKYSSMTTDEIKDLPIKSLAGDDCRLYLWVTSRYLRYAWDVVESWGFEPSTRTLVWCKPPMGTTPVTTEYILMGKSGKPPRLPWHNTTWFNWPRPHHAHSVKPPAFGDLVEAWSPAPYVELFARQPRLGWDAWGYGVESFGNSDITT